MEILAAVFTLLCVILTIKRNILSWPVSIIGIIFYIFVFLEQKLYSDFIIQFIFLFQSISGWIFWKNNLEEESELVTKVETLSDFYLLYWFVIGIFSWIFLAISMKKYTDASLPWVDSFVAIWSLIANWLLAKRKIESWIIWIIVDVIYIFLFLYKGLYASTILYSILLILAYQGLKNWKKHLI
jgi:nicotinamide mononucleotide transporter